MDGWLAGCIPPAPPWTLGSPACRNRPAFEPEAPRSAGLPSQLTSTLHSADRAQRYPDWLLFNPHSTPLPSAALLSLLGSRDLLSGCWGSLGWNCPGRRRGLHRPAAWRSDGAPPFVPSAPPPITQQPSSKGGVPNGLLRAADDERGICSRVEHCTYLQLGQLGLDDPLYVRTREVIHCVHRCPKPSPSGWSASRHVLRCHRRLREEGVVEGVLMEAVTQTSLEAQDAVLRRSRLSSQGVDCATMPPEARLTPTPPRLPSLAGWHPAGRAAFPAGCDGQEHCMPCAWRCGGIQGLEGPGRDAPVNRCQKRTWVVWWMGSRIYGPVAGMQVSPCQQRAASEMVAFRVRIGLVVTTSGHSETPLQSNDCTRCGGATTYRSNAHAGPHSLDARQRRLLNWSGPGCGVCAQPGGVHFAEQLEDVHVLPPAPQVRSCSSGSCPATCQRLTLSSRFTSLLLHSPRRGCCAPPE